MAFRREVVRIHRAGCTAKRNRSHPVPRTPDRGKYKNIHERQPLRLVGYDAGLVCRSP